MSTVYCRTSKAQQHEHGTRSKECKFTWPCLLLVSRLTSSRAENVAQHRVYEASVPLDDVLLIAAPQTKISSLPLKNISCMSLFFYGPEKKKENLAAFAKTRAESAVRTAKNYCTLEEEVALYVRAAENGLSSFTARDFCRLRKRASTRTSRFDFGLALTAPPHIESLLRHHHKDYKVRTLFSGSGNEKEGKWAKLRCAVGGWKKSASSPQKALSMERSQAKETEDKAEEIRSLSLLELFCRVQVQPVSR